MNDFQKNLYNNLMSLVETTEAFYFVDHNLNDCIYRVFTYRLASYTDFLAPDATECRGHMFRLTLDELFVELVSLPFGKFWNYLENPFTTDMDMSVIDFIHEKRDGSLISTYMHDGMVCLKSKTALASDQALDAKRLFHQHPKLVEFTTHCVRNNYTVSFEYTSPTNRIVLPYQDDELTVLGVRSNISGLYMGYDYLYEVIPDYMIINHTNDFDSTDMDATLTSIKELEGIEGFVIGLGTGQRFKIKTTQYFTLHRTKDAIQSDKNLFEVALNGHTDDLRTLFFDDQYTLDRIAKMEAIAGKVYNHTVVLVESYYDDNKHLTQKEYAVKAQKEFDRMQFNLIMSKYNGKPIMYKEAILKNYEAYMQS